ncbi:MAG: 50S ribosomal protein L11 methyltransferase [Francisella sp.]
MQPCHQLSFSLKSKDLEIIEDYLFDNNASAITNVEKSSGIISVTVFYENYLNIDDIIADIKEKFSNIIESEINYTLIQDQQWESAWLYDYDPIKIGKNIVIYPNWRQPLKDTNKIYIIIDPSIAFGCGNHETTKMCLEWLETYVRSNTTVLDYGCGTGILAISAVKLGAKYAEGIDIDPNSIESSIKNAQQNNVSHKTYFNSEAPKQKFDLVVANIFSNVLISLAENITNSLKAGGRLALSGIIANQVEKVQAEFIKYGITFNKPKQLGQWFLLDGIKNGF